MNGENRFLIKSKEVLSDSIVTIVASCVMTGLAVILHFFAGLDELWLWRILAMAIGQVLVLALVCWFVRNRTQKKVRSELEAKSLADFLERTAEFHRFAHNTRDLVVRLLGPVNSSGKLHSELISNKDFYIKLEKLLESMHSTFKPLFPPDVRIFTAIRKRREDEFDTIVRGGETDKGKRQNGTEPLHIKYKMVEELLESYYDGKDCVVITGQGEPNWHENRINDSLDEDHSVLMGAIFSKEWKGALEDTFDPIELEWLLCVAANKPKTFTDDHKSLMKCFNDIFGLVLNIYIRQQSQNKTGGNT